MPKLDREKISLRLRFVHFYNGEREEVDVLSLLSDASPSPEDSYGSRT